MGNYLIPKKFFKKGLFRFPTEQFPSLFEDLEDEMAWEQSGLTVSEDDQAFYVEAQMPGLKAKNIDVTVENGILRIHGEREEKEEDKEKRFHRRASYSFNYRLALPSQINEDTSQAVYKDGVMKVSFKKIPEKSGKKIEVKGE